MFDYLKLFLQCVHDVPAFISGKKTIAKSKRPQTAVTRKKGGTATALAKVKLQNATLMLKTITQFNYVNLLTYLDCFEVSEGYIKFIY